MPVSAPPAPDSDVSQHSRAEPVSLVQLMTEFISPRTGPLRRGLGAEDSIVETTSPPRDPLVVQLGDLTPLEAAGSTVAGSTAASAAASLAMPPLEPASAELELPAAPPAQVTQAEQAEQAAQIVPAPSMAERLAKLVAGAPKASDDASSGSPHSPAGSSPHSPGALRQRLRKFAFGDTAASRQQDAAPSASTSSQQEAASSSEVARTAHDASSAMAPVPPAVDTDDEAMASAIRELVVSRSEGKKHRKSKTKLRPILAEESQPRSGHASAASDEFGLTNL
eukprot:gnl/TRDRNA2_/TRDRNA2_155837_c1_seq1.p1 gnl/TRDRNA2_/TRDRNA2_155837_c1~~gnl/TRDRNA2_/TRDRNA2_155837_c1_seq1.p1  ORF type:complete len:281 (-),score=61.40 gnl/TRDRNA2_/TRDRNA2_155837_c1_seq1:119-961(-)